MDHSKTSHEQSSIKIAIIRLNSIGDVVLSTSCLQLLYALPIKAEVYWLGRQPSLALIEQSYPQLKCIEFNKNDRFSQLASTLTEIDLIIDLQNNINSKLFCLYMKIRHNISFFRYKKHQVRRIMSIIKARFTRVQKGIAKDENKLYRHEFQFMKSFLLTSLECFSGKKIDLQQLQISSIFPTLNLDRNKIFIDKMSHNNCLWIGIGVGASFETKAAPHILFVEILNELNKKILLDKGLQNSSFGLVFFGDANDTIKAQRVINEVKWQGPICDLTGELSLWQTTQAIALTKIILCNDTAVAHIGESLRKPVHIMFGPTSEDFGFSSWQQKSESYSAPLNCRPCSKHGKKECRFRNQKCFHDIPKDKIIQNIFSYLKK